MMTTLAYKKTANAAWLIGVAAALLIPDVILGVMPGLIHLMLEGTHLLFELIESALDHAVEHLFHTGTRETQLIVFYLMVTVGLAGCYFLWWKLKRGCLAFKNAVHSGFAANRNRLLSYWSKSAHNKFKLIAGVNIALTIVYFVGF